MARFCTRCGHEISAGTGFCTSCGHPAPSTHEPPPPVAGRDAVDVGPAPTTAAAPAPGRRRAGRVVAVVVAAVLLVGLGGAAALVVLDRGDDDGVAASDRVGGQDLAEPDERDATDDDDDDGDDDEAEAEATSTTTSTRPTTTTTTAAPPATFSGGWVVQYESIPLADGDAERDRRLGLVQQVDPAATVLRSDDWPSFVPGYWVVVNAGPWSDGPAAAAVCDRVGRDTPSQCLGRFVSRDPADRDLQCYRVDGTWVDGCRP